MRVPLSWIRDFTPVPAGFAVDDLVAALNQLGLEVEGVEEPAGEIEGVKVAKVLEVAEHPNADKLTLVDVDLGETQARVVCGARNVVAGMLVPYAPVGATIAGGVRLERRKIRGVTSDGMLCAADELGLGDDHSGILELDADAPLGADVRDVVDFDDVVFDLSITPNRPDAMCVVGVARELAAHFGWPFVVPEPSAPRDSGFDRAISVAVEAPDRCPRYLGWVARVSMGPSPRWMRDRLVKAGVRPISNVVDVTNYVLLERNQPLHVFDLDRLAGPGIVVRLADEGEHMTTLDGVDRTLAHDDLLICDAARVPQAVAGVMGGGDSEVTDGTSAILLESAAFERMGIARTSKRLKLRSEASARFERGIDPNGVASAAERAMELLAEVAGAGVAPEPVDEYPRPVEQPVIELRTSKVNGVLGTDLTDTQIVDALLPLGIEVEGAGDRLVARPPTFRPDLEREIDLVEEVARRVGFDAIGRSVARPAEQVGGLTRDQRDRRTVADVLVGAGMSEAVTIPLVSKADLAAAAAGTEAVVEVANPLRAEESVLRTRLLPGLLRAAARNRARGLGDVALFEIGHVFLASTDGSLLPDERWHVAGVLTGAVRRLPVEPDRAVDAYDATDLVRAVLGALELVDARLEPTEIPAFHPSRAAALVVDGVDAGAVGEVAADVVEAFELDAPVIAFELTFDQLLLAARRDRAFRPPSPYPPSVIDLSFVVDEAVPAASVEYELRAAIGDVLEAVRCFADYRDETSLGEGRKSLTFSLRFRVPDRTLTDDEIARLRQRAIDAVTTELGATLRG